MEPGEIRRVNVRIDRLDPDAAGKRRPGVLVAPARRPGWWIVMGLTTLPTYGDGTVREPLLEWRLSGLRRPTYLWGRRAAVVPASDVGNPIGRLAAADAETIVGMLGDELTVDMAEAFRAGATAAYPEYFGDPFVGLAK